MIAKYFYWIKMKNFINKLQRPGLQILLWNMESLGVKKVENHCYRTWIEAIIQFNIIKQTTSVQTTSKSNT